MVVRSLVFGLCAVLMGCSGTGAGVIPDGQGSTSQETNETEPTPSATSNAPSTPPATDDASAPSTGDAGVSTADASSDAGHPICSASVPVAVAFGQCVAKPAATLVGEELVEPTAISRPLTKDVPACGSLKKLGHDTFSLNVKKGDCLAFDLHAKTAVLKVSGVPGANINSAGGDDHSLAQANASGTLTITVTASVDDDYTLTVR